MVPYDQIRLRHWRVQVAIGAYEHELLGTQELVLDVRLRGDWSGAATTDSLDDALDYAAFRSSVEGWLAGRRWVLLEAFASDLCQWALQHPLVREVKVTVDKPAAQAPVSVSCTLVRRK